MNRYLVVDLENNEVASLNRVETDFKENETQTSVVSCTNLDQTKRVAIETLYNKLPLEIGYLDEVNYVLETLLNDCSEERLHKLEQLEEKDLKEIAEQMLDDQELNETISSAIEYFIDNKIGE